MITDPYKIARRRMVELQLKARDITDERVLAAMSTLPRHIFVEEALESQAYGDYPVGIGYGQTISQPYIVAFMSQELQLTGKEKVLEIGTGCGYQTAVLSYLCKMVYTIERLGELATQAQDRLGFLGITNVVMKVGDGTYGWAQEAPFHAILSAAASPDIPEPLFAQLKEGGRLIVPVGSDQSQRLIKVTKLKGKPYTKDLGACRFVKLVGRHGWQRQKKAGDHFVKRSLIID